MAVRRRRKNATRYPLPAARNGGSATGNGKRATGNDHRWFELRRSPIQGRGGFATRRIPKGTRIIEYTGEKISNAESDRRYDEEKMRRHHTFLFTLSQRTVVDAAVGGNESRFINHSCAPNCETVIEDGHIWIEALRDIRKGEELLYDYRYSPTGNKKEDEELAKFYECRCGAKTCRGTILYQPRRKRRKARTTRRAARSGQRKRRTQPAR